MDKEPFPSNVPPDTKDYNVVFIALSATALVNELSYKNKIVKLRENKNVYTITETEMEQLNLLSVVAG